MACSRILPHRPSVLACRTLLEATGRKGGYELTILALSYSWDRDTDQWRPLLVRMASTASQDRTIRIYRTENDAERWDGRHGFREGEAKGVSNIRLTSRHILLPHGRNGMGKVLLLFEVGNAVSISWPCQDSIK